MWGTYAQPMFNTRLNLLSAAQSISPLRQWQALSEISPSVSKCGAACQSTAKRIQRCHCRSPVCLWRTSAADRRWAPAPLRISFGSLLSIKAGERRARIMWQSLSHSLAFDAWGRLNQSNPCHKPAHRPRHKEIRETNRQVGRGGGRRKVADASTNKKRATKRRLEEQGPAIDRRSRQGALRSSR